MSDEINKLADEAPDGTSVGEGSPAQADEPTEPVDVESVDVESVDVESEGVGESDVNEIAEEPEAEEPEAEEPEAEESEAEDAEAEASDADDEEAEAVEAEDDEDDEDKMDWYILKVQSNREKSITAALQRKIAVEGLEEYFGDVIVPVEKVTEFKNGKKKVVQRKLYPGYIVVNMCINDATWYAVRETSGIGDFTGSGGKP